MSLLQLVGMQREVERGSGSTHQGNRPVLLAQPFSGAWTLRWLQP
jgi:hypothetical protein